MRERYQRARSSKCTPMHAHFFVVYILQTDCRGAPPRPALCVAAGKCGVEEGEKGGGKVGGLARDPRRSDIFSHF